MKMNIIKIVYRTKQTKVATFPEQILQTYLILDPIHILTQIITMTIIITIMKAISIVVLQSIFLRTPSPQ